MRSRIVCVIDLCWYTCCSHSFNLSSPVQLLQTESATRCKCHELICFLNQRGPEVKTQCPLCRDTHNRLLIPGISPSHISSIKNPALTRASWSSQGEGVFEQKWTEHVCVSLGPSVCDKGRWRHTLHFHFHSNRVVMEQRWLYSISTCWSKALSLLSLF